MSQPQPFQRLERLNLPHRHCLLPFLLCGSYSTYKTAQPHQFRFLDLPSELRNMVYEHTFAEGSRGLVPHSLTQVNRQIAQETRRWARETVRTLQIPLHTQAQLFAFLKWLAAGNANLSTNAPALELSYTDVDARITTIRFDPRSSSSSPTTSYPASSLLLFHGK